MSETRFRHAASVSKQDPQKLLLGIGGRKHGQSVPWTAEYAKSVFDGEGTGREDESVSIAAAIDAAEGEIVGAIVTTPTLGYLGLTWYPDAPEVFPELQLHLYLIEKEGSHPESHRSAIGFRAGELDENKGRLRVTHVSYRWLRKDGSGHAGNWIIGGDCSARMQYSEWDSNRNNIGKQLTDYEDVYGLFSDDLWFDYPEFDRYDHLIFRDSPALAKLGVPEEIRLKPVPAMPPEVV